MVYALFAQGLTLWPRLQGVQIIGHEHLPLQGRVILAGGHQSALDPFLAALGTRRFIHYMAKKELFKNSILGWFMTNGGSFPIDRQSKTDIGAIRKALEVLEGEGVLGIFPQGTRGGQEGMGGVAYLALKAKAPIVPMSILFHKRRWRVRYGVPISPEGSVKTLTEQVMSAIGTLDELTRQSN